MTIQSAVNDGITHDGNDSATTFSFPFKVDLNTQIEVIVRDSNGDETTKVLNTDYTVSNHNVEGSGSISYPISGDPLPTGSSITITPKMDYLQSTDIRNQGRFAPETHEDAFDTLMMHIKELRGLVNRTIKFKKSSELTGAEFGEDPVDNKLIAWDGITGKTKNAVTISAVVSSFWEAILAYTTAAASRAELDAEQIINSLTAITTLQNADQFGVADNSDSNKSKKITFQDLAKSLINGLTGISSLELTDQLPFADYSDSDYSKKITYQNFIDNFPSGENLIINGQGLIGQRGTSFTSATTPANSDDTYLLDRMLLLSDGNDIVDVSQETTEVPSGAYSSIKLDVQTANKQFAYCQIMEAKEAAKIIGGTASLSFKAKKGGSNATLETLRAAIISWDSTADSVTSDVIGTWAGAGTNPTLATNWTYENTPSDLTLTTSFQTFKIENISIDTASTNNVAVLIWCDDTDATAGDLAYIGDIKLEDGSIATPYAFENYSEVLHKCNRYVSLFHCQWRGVSGGSNYDYLGAYSFPTTMRTTPSVIVTSQTDSTRYPIANATVRSISEIHIIYEYAAASSGGNDGWNVQGYVDAEL